MLWLVFLAGLHLFWKVIGFNRCCIKPFRVNSNMVFFFKKLTYTELGYYIVILSNHRIFFKYYRSSVITQLYVYQIDMILDCYHKRIRYFDAWLKVFFVFLHAMFYSRKRLETVSMFIPPYLATFSLEWREQFR